ncbi:hypothetical protein MHYP_G00286310 [Metynnis hypsauchen]
MLLTEQRDFACLLLYEAARSVSFTQQSHLLKCLKKGTEWVHLSCIYLGESILCRRGGKDKTGNGLL